MSKILLTLPKEYLKAVDEAAKSQHRTRSELIRETIRLRFYHPKRTAERQAEIDEAFKLFEKTRKATKPMSIKEIMRQARSGL